MSSERPQTYCGLLRIGVAHLREVLEVGAGGPQVRELLEARRGEDERAVGVLGLEERRASTSARPAAARSPPAPGLPRRLSSMTSLAGSPYPAASGSRRGRRGLAPGRLRCRRGCRRGRRHAVVARGLRHVVHGGEEERLVGAERSAPRDRSARTGTRSAPCARRRPSRGARRCRRAAPPRCRTCRRAAPTGRPMSSRPSRMRAPARACRSTHRRTARRAWP